MENSRQEDRTEDEAVCRRNSRRTTLPVEVELSTGSLTVAAVIRDVSLSETGDDSFIGIGIFHNDELPLDETLSCRTVSPSKILPSESTVSLMWTRHFGQDGFLSGGRMSGNPGAGGRCGTTVEKRRQSSEMAHQENEAP